MRLRSRLRWLLDRALLGHRLAPALQSELDPAVARSVADRIWREYAVRLARLPQPHSHGGGRTQRMAALGLSLYRALVSRGVAPDAARGILRDFAWHLYRRMGLIAWALAWAPGLTRQERTLRAWRQFRRLYFSSPEFRWREQPAGADGAAPGTDCLRCPIAEQFIAADLADVAVHSICALDRRLAAAWGVRFHRTQTLADGGTHCDFRWPVARGRTAAIVPIKADAAD